jgi:hypothetical protein
MITAPFVRELASALSSQGFEPVADAKHKIANIPLLLKKQTWNINRAVAVVVIDRIPSQFDQYLFTLRKQIAWRCGFIPFFFGIGIQIIVVAPDIAKAGLNPSDFVARFDNQWAIVQSLFLVDCLACSATASRSPSQFITGKFQDTIATVLSRHYEFGNDWHHTGQS